MNKLINYTIENPPVDQSGDPVIDLNSCRVENEFGELQVWRRHDDSGIYCLGCHKYKESQGSVLEAFARNGFIINFYRCGECVNNEDSKFLRAPPICSKHLVSVVDCNNTEKCANQTCNDMNKAETIKFEFALKSIQKKTYNPINVRAINHNMIRLYSMNLTHF
tara:strand:- start:19878 stop:20369 length:492 start_codon:yes stop_codon:yes gene_type:complete